MKYIKEIKEYSYYELISPNRPDMLPMGVRHLSPINISTKDIGFIKDELGILNKVGIFKIYQQGALFRTLYQFYYNTRNGEVGNLNNISEGPSRLVKVCSYTDEWFKVMIDDRSYWCDQAEGVVRCVKDSINKDVYYNYINEGSLDVYLDVYSSVMKKIRNISNSDYYQELSDDDRAKLSEMLIDMDDNTYNILYNKLKGLGYTNISKDTNYCISAIHDWVNMHIYSCSDDWFIVVANGYYKCDQLMGVIKLIDDIHDCIGSKSLKESVGSYYYKITSDEYGKLLELWNIPNNSLKFTSMEIKLLKELDKFATEVGDYSFSMDISGATIYNANRISFVMAKRASTLLSGQVDGGVEILGRMYKLEDEWYLVEKKVNNRRVPKFHPYSGISHHDVISDIIYYKCDQMDGLLSLLKDIIIYL